MGPLRAFTAGAACVATAAALAACGSSGHSTPSVSMKQLRFHPARVEVKVGQKVTWTNDDTVDHNVTATSGAHFMSQAFSHGQRYSYVPRAPGTIAYVCTLHPGMSGTLVVKK